MYRRSNWVIGMGLAASLLMLPELILPVLAHKTEVSGDVAGIWHLEPNHSPKAGEPAQVWVALTQQGGKIIPLEQCDCRLTVYDVGENEDSPILQPVLESISAESFQGIPGAKVTFPDIGEYRLVLTGSPQGEGTFAPFELSYTAVVAAGRDRAAARVPNAESPGPTDLAADVAPLQESLSAAAENNRLESDVTGKTLWVIGGAGVALMACVTGAIWLRRHQKNQN